MSLQIYTSNRMEQLVDGLAGVVARPLASPFARETIVVQSKGMQRWLSMELASRFGAWANGDFPFPNAFVWRLFRDLIAGLPDKSPYDPAVLTWRVMGLLPAMLGRPGFEPLAAYLGGGAKDGAGETAALPLCASNTGLKLFQLSEKIADTFDQYTLFRPELLSGWEAGRGDDWQSALWRELVAQTDAPHRARVRDDFARMLLAPGFDRGLLPSRVSLFGVSYLPQFHLDVFALLARHAEVNLFLLSPCAEYWGDLVSARERARQPQSPEPGDEGNPLLSSLGRLGRDFSDTVLSLDAPVLAQNDQYVPAGYGAMLHALQSDILLLRSPTDGLLPLSPADRSLRFHSCHSPMREVEVLHDQLLACLEEDPTLAPRDILVMTPDIETYAPMISAVFDGVEDVRQRIPYSIADRGIRRDGDAAEALLAILALPGGRFGVTSVLDILESPPVGRRFEISGNELETVRDWLVQTGVRWGLDEEDRARRGAPPYRDNSWRAGLDRLLLGFAMPDEGRLFAGILPFDGVEGEGASILGRFAEFVESLAAACRELERPRRPEEWVATVRSLLDTLLAVDEEGAREMVAISRVLDDLVDCQRSAQFSGEVTLDMFRSWMAEQLEREDRGLGFLTGSGTFCAMLPMRSIPFRVIALLGMNDGAFPRQNRPPGFDLMARHPRRGDRSLRDEDRYLFLEAILSARDRLHISFVGQGIRDNAEIPPSVLVSELVDYVEARFEVCLGETSCSPSAEPVNGEGKSETGQPRGVATELVFVRHPLQPFSPAYFTGQRELFSYSMENCAALREKFAGKRTDPPFLSRPLPDAPEFRDITIATLLRFFDNPVKFLLMNRLGIRLGGAAAPLEEREPFSLDHLDNYGLKQELVAACLEGGVMEDLLPVARGRGILPPARHGDLLFADLRREAAGFAEKVRARAGTMTFLPPLEVELELEGFRLSGRIAGIAPERLVRYRCARMKGKDQFRLWVEHLILNTVADPAYPRESLLIMADRCITLSPVADAGQQLANLLGWFRAGLSEPLRFFPETSLAYGAKGEWNPDRARRAWEGSEFAKGEGEDPYLDLCFRREDPLAGDFDRIARELLSGMLASMA